MNECDVRRYGLILAVQAEIDGMKAENTQREQDGKSLAYPDEAFQTKAVELRNLSYCPDEHL